MTKKEQCKADLVPIWGPNPKYDKLPIEKMRKEYHEYCPKSKSNSIVFCPKQIIKRKNDKRVQWQNDHLNDYIKSLGGKDEKGHVVLVHNRVGSNIGWNPEVLRGRASGAERVESTNEEYTNGTEAKESQQVTFFYSFLDPRQPAQYLS